MKIKSVFLVNVHNFVEYYQARTDQEPTWSEKWDITA